MVEIKVAPWLGADAHDGCDVADHVPDKHIMDPVAIARHKIVGRAGESYIASIRGHRRAVRGVVGEPAVCAQAHQYCFASQQVAHKHIGGVVRVSQNQVARAALKQRVTPVGRDSNRKRITIPISGSVKINADEHGRVVSSVSQEDVDGGGEAPGWVRSEYDEIVGGAAKEHVTSIPTDDRKVRVPSPAGGRGKYRVCCRDK